MTSAIDIASALPAAQPAAPTLRDLLEDGIYLLFLLRDMNAPESCASLNQRLDQFFASFEKQARNFGKPAEQAEHARYAFCALLDEIVLSAGFPLQDEWARMPLQLRLFGEHLAGEGFFERLRALRADPVKNIEVLEVFHVCLLLGFQGKFLLEGLEKRDYLTHQLGQEIQRIRGGGLEFAPNWKLPHRFQEFVRNEMSLWVWFALLALVGVVVFVAYRLLLGSQASLIISGA